MPYPISIDLAIAPGASIRQITVPVLRVYSRLEILVIRNLMRKLCNTPISQLTVNNHECWICSALSFLLNINQFYFNSNRSVNDKIMHHDAVVIKLATIEAEKRVLEQDDARLQSLVTQNFDPSLIDYSIAVGRVYFNLRDAFVDQMKRLHEATNYQFLEDRPFSYDDSSVAMLEAWMATNKINMLQRMEMIGNQDETYNVNAGPLENCILLNRGDYPEAFKSLDLTGNMSFVITGAEDQLAPMSHVHMTNVKVWLPGIKVKSGHLRVWLRRYGTSKVYDQSGNPWTFTHGARTMMYEYATENSAGLKQYHENTKIEIDEKNGDYVALSPIGPWSLSVSKRYNPGLDTRKVKAIYLQMAYTFLPCDQAECPIRSRKSAGNDEIAKMAELTDATNDVEGHSEGSVVGLVIGLACAAIVTIVAVVALYVQCRKKPSLLSMNNQNSYQTI